MGLTVQKAPGTGGPRGFYARELDPQTYKIVSEHEDASAPPLLPRRPTTPARGNVCKFAGRIAKGRIVRRLQRASRGSRRRF